MTPLARLLLAFLLVLAMCSATRTVRAQTTDAPVAGAFGPVEDTPIELEHLVVDYDLTELGPERARVRLQAVVHNPSSQPVESTMLLLAGLSEVVVERDGVREPVERVETDKRQTELSGGPATTFELNLDPGARARLVLCFEVEAGRVARARVPTREFLFRLPARVGWQGYGTASLFVRTRRTWGLATLPATALISSGPDQMLYGVSLGPDQADWLRLQVSWDGPPAWMLVTALSTLLSLIAGSLALAWPRPVGRRALALGYLAQAPAYLWLHLGGALAWTPGPLAPLLCFAVGPLLSAAFAVLNRR